MNIETWVQSTVKSPMEFAKKSKIILSKYRPVAQWVTSPLQGKIKPLQHWQVKIQFFLCYPDCFSFKTILD